MESSSYTQTQSIVLIGGFMSHWSSYLNFGEMLRHLSNRPVFIARLEPIHWLHSGAFYPEQLLTEIDLVAQAAHDTAGADNLTLIGHSIGGLLARLYINGSIGEQNRIRSYYRHVNRIITLGTPNQAHYFLNRSIAFIAKHVPPTFFYLHIDYCTVAGRFVFGKKDGTILEQRAYNNYQTMCRRGDVWGDGVIPVDTALLPGTRMLALDNIAHSPRQSPLCWYGANEATILRWWLPLVQE